MLNQVVMVGRLVKNPELKETENGKKVTHITLAVPRVIKTLMVNMILITLIALYGLESQRILLSIVKKVTL